MKGAVCLIACLLLAGCANDETATEVSDPSQLSEELEAEAKGIEDRASAAVREAEALAEGELQEMQEAARAADIAENDGEARVAPEAPPAPTPE